MGTKAAEIQRWENKGSFPKTVWVRWKWHLAEIRIKKKEQAMQRSGQRMIQVARPASV